VAVDLFPPTSSSELPGPAWLRTRRAKALAALAEMELPDVGQEEWRYSRIAELRPERFTLVDAERPEPAGGHHVPVPAATALAELGELAGAVVVHNGVVVVVELAEDVAGSGVVLRVAGDDDEALLGAALDTSPDAFAALNDAHCATPVVLSVPRGVTVERPFAVVDVTDADGVVTFPRLSVVAGENSELSLVEISLSSDVEALVAPLTDISVGAAARVRHSTLQDVGRRVWRVATLVAAVQQDATLRSSSAALGGDYARQRTDCRLLGRGAHGDLSSVYFGDGDQMLDLRTFQEHRAPDTSSNLLFKGAVADRSHSVYTGLIRIAPEARGTNAFQTNRNLKLSDEAWAESVPNLEIENNDVHCSHASTVGPVDEDQRFYLESRGVPDTVAERLIVGGFFDEVLDDLPVQALAAPVRARLDVLLDQQMGAAHVGGAA
jgi:Fe-S cluster assembly protein SufD